MKKVLITILSVTILSMSLYGCGGTNKKAVSSDLSDTTVTGQVTKMNDTDITLQLGELKENDISTDKTPSKDTSSGKNTSVSDNTNNSDNAYASDTSSSKTADAAPFVSETPSFTASNKSITIDVSSAAINVEGKSDDITNSVDNIAMDDILEVTFDDNGNVISVTVKNLGDNSTGSKDVTNGTSSNTMEGNYYSSRCYITQNQF